MEQKLAPDFRLVAIDETRNWAEDITQHTGRIAGVYLINFAEVTHCCEITPSYWAEFVCNIFEHDFREPDGYDSGKPIWDDSAFEGDPEYKTRSEAIEAAKREPYISLQYENGGEDGSYFHCHSIDGLKKSAPVEIDPESDNPARDAMEGVQEYMANGEDWADLAPWNKESGE